MSLFPKFDPRTILPNPAPAPAKPAKPAKVISQTPENTETLTGLATLAASAGRIILSKAVADAPRGSPDTSADLMGKLGVHAVLVTDELSARRRIKELIATGEMLGFDIETTPKPGHGDHPTLGPVGLDPHRSRIRTVQLYGAGTEALVIDMATVPFSVLDPLWCADLVAHNAVFETRFLDLIRHPAPTIQCSMLLARHILSRKTNMNLAYLAEERLGLVVPKDGQTSDWSGKLSEEQIAYAAADAVLARQLYDNLHPEILAASKAYDIAVAAQPTIAWAINQGVAFDTDRLAALKEQWEAEHQAALAKWEAVAPGITPTKPTEMQPWLRQILSPQQLKDWPLTKSGKLSTKKPVIAAKVGDVPELAPLRDLSKSKTRLSNYGKLPDYVNPETRRIHPGYQLCGAITGRMSCSEPNVQSQERGDLRSAYVARSGRKFVGADWSMMELRAAAIISGDPKMLAALESGKDLHIQTAASVTGKPEKSINKSGSERNLAKALGFGLLYGMGAPAFKDYAANSYGVEMSLEQAKRHRKKYFLLYAGLRRWQGEQSSASIRSYSASTRYGRCVECRKPDGSYHYTRSLNVPIQGSCADALHEALARLPAALAGLDAHPVIIVHDEIILDTSEADAAVAAERLADVMAEAFLAVFPEAENMSGLTETAIGDTWADTKA
jgi:DNA polymerase-1